MAPSPRYRRRRKGDPFYVPTNQRKGPPPGPEILPWYWHPEREGAIPPPAAFDAQLKAIDKDLAVCYSPVHERWLIWVRNPRIGADSRMASSWMCRGWQLLFIWEHAETHEMLQLNELVFHNLFYISNKRFPNAAVYFDKIQAECKKVADTREADYQQNRRDSQRDFMGSQKISTAGRGNRAALHHSGTVVESQGEALWRAQTRSQRLPGEVIRREADDKEKRFYSND